MGWFHNQIEERRRAEHQARLDGDDRELVRDERPGRADKPVVVEVPGVAAAHEQRDAREEVELELGTVDEALVERVGVHLADVGAESGRTGRDGGERERRRIARFMVRGG